MKNLYFLLVVIALFQCKSQEETKGPDYTAAIDSTTYVLETVKDASHVPGMAVAIMVDGEMVLSYSTGYADLENKIPANPDQTLWRIGSVSKSFSSLALGKLYEDGKLDFDADVRTYVSDFPEKKYPITVKEVAGHIAGIRHYRDNEMMNDQYYASVNEGLEIFKNDSLLFEPGTDYSYSSYGWNLLSAVVEGASGQDFLSYMRNEILDPMGLDNIKADYATEEIPGRTKFYYYSEMDGIQEAPYVDNSYKWAGGGYIATVTDMVRFGNYMLDPMVISNETVDLLIESQVINDTTMTNYGMGWRNATTDNGYHWFGHSGGSVGGITQLVIYPESKVVVGITSNTSRVDYQGIQHSIAQWFTNAKAGSN